MNYSNLSSPSLNRRYGAGKDEYRRESSNSSLAHHYHRKNNGRSKSPEHSSRHISAGGTKIEETRIQSLSSQLASAQSQVLQLEAEVSNTRTAKNHAEHRLITIQRDLNSLQTRNSEVISVMKTLEAGVEALQKEKVSLVMERDELRAKLEAAEKNNAILNEQVSYLNERNSTLSKKCVDLLDGSKDFREKASAYEEELKRIKPCYEEMNANFSKLNEDNKSITSRLNMYEMRERIWIREKTEFEQRHKETIEKWQRSIADLRAQHESDRERAVRAEREKCAKTGPNGNGPTRAEMEKVERHIKDLHALLESIQLHHSNELNQYRRRILELESNREQEEEGQRCAEEGQERKCNGTGKGREEEGEVEIIFVENNTSAEPNKTIGGPTQQSQIVGEQKEEAKNNMAG